MENNKLFYNAVIIGCVGSLSTIEPERYDAMLIGVQGLAAAVDALIDPIVDGPSVSQVALLQEVTQVKTSPLDWFETGYYIMLPGQIVAMYNSVKDSLKP